MHDPMEDLIHANRDELLRKYEEAVHRVRRCLERGLADKGAMKFVMENKCKLAVQILDALRAFHPMHGESWQGWPAGSDE